VFEKSFRWYQDTPALWLLWFKRAIVPKGCIYKSKLLEIIPVSRVVDAIAIALISSKSDVETREDALPENWSDD
jgi:hypothetical protein